MMNYAPGVSADINSSNSVRKQMMSRIDIKKSDEILADDPEHADPTPIPGTEADQDLLNAEDSTANESITYNPLFGDFAAVNTDNTTDNTDLENLSDPNKDPLLTTKEGEPDPVLEPEKEENYVPSEIVDYYNEAALSSKARNALPDSEFGIPRMRAYPLNDEKHVRLAIQMFSHCKDPKDKASLAKKIFAKAEQFNMDVTIEKDSALYEYAPKSLREASEMDPVVPSMDIPMGLRTEKDIIKEHLNQNSLFYNHIFFSPDYIRSLRTLKEYDFFNYFYPNFSTHNFPYRMKTAIGGMAMIPEVYRALKIRPALELDYTKNLGWADPQVKDFDISVNTYYDTQANWFHQDLSDDLNHIFYCLRLYSVVGEIMLDPNFTMDRLTPMHVGLMTDWIQRVSYHYDLFTRAPEGSTEKLKEAQYLFDLLWNCTDNPYSKADIEANVYEMAARMASGKQLVANMNENYELISKEQCTGYLVHELNLDDDMFLLPSTLEYPIIDAGSIRLAMDCIRRVPKEQQTEYAKNLNRKYREYGCTFSISIDHPYAKFADQNIIDHMNRILMEGDTCVQDDGTSADPSDRSTLGNPWQRRVDLTGNVGQNLLQNKELGANDKKHPDPNYTREQSLI